MAKPVPPRPQRPRQRCSCQQSAIRLYFYDVWWLTAECYPSPMFSRKIRVEYEHEGNRLPCPLKWLDSFSMRNFTNASLFDDTLPVANGLMEIGERVPIEELRDAMRDWFRRKGYLKDESEIIVRPNS